MRISNYIKQCLSFEEYSFSLTEVLHQSGKSEIAVKSELSRLVKKKEIISLRKGFYLIIPPRYATFEKLPIQLYAEKLFKYLEREYYLGLYTAAKIHGASHQQLQRDYLIIKRPKLREIRKKNIGIRFFTTTSWPPSNIQTKRADAGNYKISDPALTITDLVHHHPKLGGLNRMLSVIEELGEELTIKQMKELLNWYSSKSTLQRVGYLLEELDIHPEITEYLYERLKQKPFYPVLLSPKRKEKPGSVKNRWKIDVNIKLDSDL